MYCDNKTIIHNTINKRISINTERIAVRYNFVRSVVMKSKIMLEYLRIEYMLADPLTKSLSNEKDN